MSFRKESKESGGAQISRYAPPGTQARLGSGRIWLQQGGLRRCRCAGAEGTRSRGTTVIIHSKWNIAFAWFGDAYALGLVAKLHSAVSCWLMKSKRKIAPTGATSGANRRKWVRKFTQQLPAALGSDVTEEGGVLFLGQPALLPSVEVCVVLLQHYMKFRRKVEKSRTQHKHTLTLKNLSRVTKLAHWNETFYSVLLLILVGLHTTAPSGLHNEYRLGRSGSSTAEEVD